MPSRMVSREVQPVVRIFFVEENERIVTNPAAVTAGVIEAGVKRESLADPSNRIPYLAKFSSAEIKNFDAMFCPNGQAKISDVEHCRKAVLDVKIRFTLRAVAEDAEMI